MGRRRGPAGVLPPAALSLTVLCLLGGCVAVTPQNDLSRSSVQSALYDGCMADAGWNESRALTASSERAFVDDAARCTREMELFSRPTLAERIRLYDDEVASARCLRRVGYDPEVPTLADYLAADPESAWTAFDAISSVPGDQSFTAVTCPPPHYR